MLKKLNALILRRIARKGHQSMPTVVAVRVDENAIMLETRVAGSDVATTKIIPWKSVSRVAAAREANYVGDDPVLTIKHLAGVVELTCAVSGYEELLSAMEHELKHCKPRAQWQTELIAADVGMSISLLA